MTRIHVLLLSLVIFIAGAGAERLTTFANPFYQGEDPWVIYHGGSYYVCTSGPVNPTAVYVSKSPTLLDRGEKVRVWEDADNYHRVFAPELHYINGAWYIYLCADVRTQSWAHMAVVLQAQTSDPLGGFVNRGVLFTGDARGNFQANDFTVVTFNNQLYAFWGTLSDPYLNGVVVAPMDNPTTITAYRSEIGLLAEGPRAIIRNNKLIMTGSAGPFASKGYCMTGVMYTSGSGSIQNRSSWTSLDTLFKTTTNVWGPARASFTVSADSTEFWMMYHSKTFYADDNGMRQVNIKEFTFRTDDTPDFGTPPGPAVFVSKPSGDTGIGEVYQAENSVLGGGAVRSSSHAAYSGTGYVDGFTAVGASSAFSVAAPRKGNYRVAVRYANGVVVAGEQQSFPTIYPPGKGSLTVYVNGAKVRRTYFDRTTNGDVWMIQGEILSLEAGTNTVTYLFDTGDNGLVELDYIALSPYDAPLHGLIGNYFDNADLTNPRMTRRDPEIHFDWGNGSPDPLIGVDSFSVRWTGFVEPLYSQRYTFYSKSDNGRRLWVNNVLIIDKWLNDWDSTYTGTITLEAGRKYSLRYEYFELYGGANTRLEWSSTSQVREIIQSARLYPDSASVAVIHTNPELPGDARPIVCGSGKSAMTVYLCAPEAGIGVLDFFSISGKRVTTQKRYLSKGQNRLTIDKKGFTPGSYFVVYSRPHGRQVPFDTRRFVVY